MAARDTFTSSNNKQGSFLFTLPHARRPPARARIHYILAISLTSGWVSAAPATAGMMSATPSGGDANAAANTAAANSALAEQPLTCMALIVSFVKTATPERRRTASGTRPGGVSCPRGPCALPESRPCWGRGFWLSFPEASFVYSCCRKVAGGMACAHVHLHLHVHTPSPLAKTATAREYPHPVA